VLPPVIGAAIGYITNAIAVKMLFKPYKEYRILKVKVPFTPGIIPKQRDKIAQGIGQIVSQKLLNADTLKRGVKTKGMRGAIALWIKDLLLDILNYPISTLADVLKRLFKKDFEHYYNLILDKAKSLVKQATESQNNKEIIETLLSKAIEVFMDKNVDDVIGTDIIQEAISKITSSTLKESKHQERVFSIVEGFFNQIFNSEQKIKDILPDSLMNAVSLYIKQRLPGLLENISEWMEDPRIKDVIRKKILQVLTDYMNSLNVVQSVVVGLLGVEEKIAEKIPYFIDRLGSEIGTLSRDEKFMKYLEDKVEMFLDHFLEKNMNSLTKESKIPLKKLLVFFRRIFEDIIGDPAKIKVFLQDITSGFNLHNKKLSSFINEEEQNAIKTKIVNTAFSYLSSEQGQENIMVFIKGRLDNFIFNREIGSLSSVFPVKKSTVLTISKRATRVILYFLDKEIPVILKSLDLEKMVRERIDSFPLDEVEDIILRIIKEQLKYINIFGGLLGFLIGLIQIFIR
jgi:uncharacterized membrane protein YheB (UPF0754 family)